MSPAPIPKPLSWFLIFDDGKERREVLKNPQDDAPGTPPGWRRTGLIQSIRVASYVPTDVAPGA